MTCHGPRLRWHLSLLRPPSSLQPALGLARECLYHLNFPALRSTPVLAFAHLESCAPSSHVPRDLTGPVTLWVLLLRYLRGSQLSQSPFRISSWFSGFKKPNTSRARHSTRLVLFCSCHWQATSIIIGDRGQFLIHSHSRPNLPPKARLTHRNPQTFGRSTW